VEEHQINVAVRITALETILVHVAKVAFLASGGTEEGLDHLRRDAAEKLAAEGLPGMDASLSDHISAELESGVDRLIVKIRSAVSSARSQLLSELGQA
jgi:hypothetical protein